MTAIRKFLFDTSFDEDPPDDRPEADDAPPPITEADLRSAYDQGRAEGRAEGREEGREAGRTEALSGAEHLLARAVERVGASLEELARVRDATFEACARDAIALAHALARRVLPGRARAAAAESLEALVHEVLPELFDEPRLVVRVAPPLVIEIQQRLEVCAAEAAWRGDVIVMADNDMRDDSCRVQWVDGGIERDPARLWAEIDALAQRRLAAPQAEPIEERKHG